MPPTRIRWTSPTVFAAAVLVALTLFAYSRALTCEYVWDDDAYLTKNRLLEDVDGLRHVWIPDGERRTPQYYPLVFTTFWVERQVWGLHPAGYHAVNVLLHLANALLAWAVLARAKVAGAWLVGALFAVHPVHVESVAWITERKNVLSGLFYLVAALAYQWFDESLADGDDRRAARRYVVVFLLFGAALLSKSVTASLPVVLLILHVYRRRPLELRRLVPLVPMLALGAAAGWNTAVWERWHVGAVGTEYALTFGERILGAARALVFYPWKLAWPVNLSFVYRRWDHAGELSLGLLALVLAGAAVAAGVVCWRRGRRGPLSALAFHAVTLFPALGFVAVYPFRFSFVADHFQYLASLGAFSLVAAAVATRLPDLRRLVTWSLLPLLLLASLSWFRCAAFQDEEALWRDTLRKNDEAWLAHVNLCAFLLEQGDRSQGGGAESAYSEAQSHCERGVELAPGEHLAHANLAETYRRIDRLDDAIDSLERAAEARPSLWVHHHRRGELLWRRGRTQEAVDALHEAILRCRPGNPCDPITHETAGRLLVSIGELDRAEQAFRTVVRAWPDHAEALLFLAERAHESGRRPEAIEYFERAGGGTFAGEDGTAAGLGLVRLLLDVEADWSDAERAMEVATILRARTLGGDANVQEAFAQAAAYTGNLPAALDALRVALQLRRLDEDAEAVARLEKEIADLQASIE